MKVDSIMYEKIAINTDTIKRTLNFDSPISTDGQNCTSEAVKFAQNKYFSENILDNSVEKISCTKLLSPKIISRYSKFKLNLDIPKNITNNKNPHDENYFSVEKKNDDVNYNFYTLNLSQRLILPTSEQLDLLKSSQVKDANIDMKQQKSAHKFNNQIIHCCRDIDSLSLSSSPPSLPSNKLKYNTHLKNDNVVISTTTDISPSKIIIPHFLDKNIDDKIETHVSMYESTIDHNNSWTGSNLSFKFHWWKVPLTVCYRISSWLPNKIFKLIKTNYQRFCQFFIPIESNFATIQRIENVIDGLTQITSTIRADNEKIISLFINKLNHMEQELNQVHRLNETALSVLKTELETFKNTSDKIVVNNDTLTNRLTAFSKKLDDAIQLNSIFPSQFSGSAITSDTPPPPPPPLPPPSIPHSQIVTMKSENHNFDTREPIRKCSTPMTEGQQFRPLITVEDLLKVNLKKTPRTNKENNPGNNVQMLHGPVVSLDMLRSVKLKSTRRSKSNADTKNIRSPRRTFKGRGTQSFSVSPIKTGAVSPLSKILKQVDNRRESKKALMSPIHSDNDLTKNNSKQFDVARSSKSHTIIV